MAGQAGAPAHAALRTLPNLPSTTNQITNHIYHTCNSSSDTSPLTNDGVLAMIHARGGLRLHLSYGAIYLLRLGRVQPSGVWRFLTRLSIGAGLVGFLNRAPPPALVLCSGMSACSATRNHH